jgi:hypothetical protein
MNQESAVYRLKARGFFFFSEKEKKEFGLQKVFRKVRSEERKVHLCVVLK